LSSSFVDVTVLEPVEVLVEVETKMLVAVWWQ